MPAQPPSMLYEEPKYSQRPDSIISVSSIYSQETHEIPITDATRYKSIIAAATPTTATTSAPRPPEGHYQCYPPKPSSPIYTKSTSTDTLVASPHLHPSNIPPPERLWTTAPSQDQGGVRTETKSPRGVVSSPGAGGSQWQLALETILQYNFRNPDLLEEALESPGSGVVVVGRSNRVCVDGNEGLARVGTAVMKLVLRDQCYLFKIAEKEVDPIITSILGWRNLEKLGRRTKIETMIRPRAPVRPRRKHNILSLLKDDALREDPTRTIARGIKAIVGAVYYDAGYEAARRVIGQLGLIIKP